MIRHFLTIAFRNLWKYKGQNLIGILGLTVGFILLAAAGAILTYFTKYDKQYPDYERIYSVELKEGASYDRSGYEFLSRFSEIEDIASLSRQMLLQLEIVSGQEKELVYNVCLSEVNPGIFDFFGLPILEGDKQSVIHSDNSLVLTESVAKKIGGEESVLGKVAVVENCEYTITGIIKELPKNSSLSDNQGFILNKRDGFYLKEVLERWKYYTFSAGLFIKLPKNISSRMVEDKINTHSADFTFETEASGNPVRIVPVAERGLKSTSVSFLWIVSATGILVLLVALFNYISFQTAQFYNRLKECTVRKVNGAGKLEQFLLFYLEVAIVIFISCLLGLLFLEVLKPIFEQSSFKYLLSDYNVAAIPLEAIKWKLLQYTLFGVLVAGVLCIIPVGIIDRLSSRVILLGVSGKGTKQTGRQILLFIQLLILLVFITAGVIIHLQTSRMKNNVYSSLSKEEQKNILFTPFHAYRKYLEGNQSAVINTIAASPSVLDVVNSPGEILYRGWGELKMTAGTENDREIEVFSIGASGNFFDFMNIEIKSGSPFSGPDDLETILVDESFAASYTDHNPIGHITSNSHYSKRIIGVAENINVGKERDGKSLVLAYEQTLPEIARCLYVKSLPGKTEEVKRQMEETIHQFVPESLDVHVSSFYDEIDHLFRDENRLSSIATFFFIVSLILCLLSIYSAITMSTERRRKEIAIRKINGASPGDIILLFSKSYMYIWTLASLVVFTPAYYFGKMWISTFTRQIELGLMPFVGIYLSVLLLIFATIIFRILSAARLNPAEVLKNE